MSGELHEISASIGALQAEAESSREGRKILHQKMDGLKDALVDVAAAIRESNQRVATLAEDMATIKPEVAKWTQTRHRAAGMLVGATMFSAGAGAAAWEGLTKLLRGN